MTDVNHVRTALARMDPLDRRALEHAARTRVDRDPENRDPITGLWYGILCTLVDLHADLTEAAHQARRDGRQITDDPSLIAELEKLLGEQ